MKQLFLGLCLMLSFQFIHAQTQKGTLLLGGNGNIGIASSSGFSTFSLGLNPNIGIFIKDNLAIGGVLNFGLASSDNFTSTVYGISPFIRNYFDLLSDNKKIFITAQVGIIGQSIENLGFESSSSGLNLLVGAGMDFFLSEQVAFEVLLNYNYQNINELGNSNNFGVNVGFQIFLTPEE